MRLLGIAGSLRAGSHNAALLRAAAGRLPEGVHLDVYEELALIPPYSEDDDFDPAHDDRSAGGFAGSETVARLRGEIAGHDGLVIATPEYNGSIPGTLKNALDWASRPHATNALRGKPALVVGASSGIFGAIWAQEEVRKVLRTIGADVVDDEVGIGQAHDVLHPVDGLTDPDALAALDAGLAALLDRLSTPV